MKKALRILSLVLALLFAACAFAACTAEDAPATDTGSAQETPATDTDTARSDAEATVTITVEVVDDKGETTKFTIKTAEKYLRGALEQENLVEGEDGAYGLYIKKVNGISADYETDGAYWSVYEGDAQAMTGVDGIELKDGGVYKLVYTKA